MSVAFSGPPYREYLSLLRPEQRRTWFRWLRGRPLEVRELATRNPPGTPCEFDGKAAYVVGYAEGDPLPGYLLSYTDPVADYDRAVAEKFFLCAACAHGGHEPGSH